jgi:hypothetical protein
LRHEAVVFLNHFKDLPDPRQLGKVIYPLDEVLLLCLLAVLTGAEAFVDIARFGEKKIDLLRRFRSFRDGTPSHDQLGDEDDATFPQPFPDLWVTGGFGGHCIDAQDHVLLLNRQDVLDGELNSGHLAPLMIELDPTVLLDPRAPSTGS